MFGFLAGESSYVCKCSFTSVQRNLNQFTEVEVTNPHRPTATFIPTLLKNHTPTDSSAHAHTHTHKCICVSKLNKPLKLTLLPLGVVCTEELKHNLFHVFFFFFFDWSCQSAPGCTARSSLRTRLNRYRRHKTLEIFYFIIQVCSGSFSGRKKSKQFRHHNIAA